MGQYCQRGLQRSFDTPLIRQCRLLWNAISGNTCDKKQNVSKDLVPVWKQLTHCTMGKRCGWCGCRGGTVPDGL
jgi:hypothetical protein